ncbi:MAG TPA: hypothetical protein VI039_12940 [Solirubrobacterales bacterium]
MQAVGALGTRAVARQIGALSGFIRRWQAAGIRATLLGVESPRGHIQPVPDDNPVGRPPSIDPSVDPGPFLSALREAAEHESHKEELVGGKTRGIVTAAGAYFAVVQTAAFSGALGRLEGTGRAWTIGLAIGAMALLSLALLVAVAQQWPRTHDSLPSRKIGQDLTDLLNGKKTQKVAIYDLATRYAGVTASRYRVNNQRLKLYYAAAVLSVLAVGATTAELAVSLATRI